VSRTPPEPAERELYEALWTRQTNRGPFTDERVPASALARLQQADDEELASLRVLDRRDTARVLTLAREAGQQLSDSRSMPAASRHQAGAARTPDGVDAICLIVAPT
jgi:hypothetical protein